jgi:transcription initiation factor IIE alpha subunit
MANRPIKICKYKYCGRVDFKGRKKCPSCGSKMVAPDAKKLAEIKKKLNKAADTYDT